MDRRGRFWILCTSKSWALYLSCPWRRRTCAMGPSTPESTISFMRSCAGEKRRLWTGMTWTPAFSAAAIAASACSGVRGERLFDHAVFACFGSTDDVFTVKLGFRGNADGIDVIAGEKRI